MVEVNGMNFNKEVLADKDIVVADFWAPWCNPCRMLMPILSQVSDEMSGKVKFVRINVDQNPQLAQMLNVTNLPTLMVFNKGKLRDRMIGFRPKNEVVKLVKKHL
ncbi:thioredoxin [Hathewaya limosa]|uniref:Thioredoxin n=1 Tax=Hathewaya limosa TaxID=1536 RepID=A0ABU0JSI4_HATLI|nr:thioredoxin [Hathewaya limosa]AWZ47506.1 thioredoxin [Clostridiaceae bacterium 14S0207]MDQ0480043.1 thioredoxin 1 [Hathewaya limosa]